MAVSNKTAKKIKSGVGDRIRPANEQPSIEELKQRYGGVMPPSVPKPAIAPPYKDKRKFR